MSIPANSLTLEQAFANMEKDALILASLRQYAQKITVLRQGGLPDVRIAAYLAIVFESDIEVVLALIQTEFDSIPDRAAGSESKSSFGTSKLDPTLKVLSNSGIHVPASQIRRAIEQIMRGRNIQVFRLNNEAIVDEILDMVPDLKKLAKHIRNRKIIDSCLNRNTGPRARTEKGVREITLNTDA